MIKRSKIFKERIAVPSTAKGIAELLAGLGVLGLSQEFWTQLIGTAIMLYGLVDIWRNERKTD